jgi:hypothetical protein
VSTVRSVDLPEEGLRGDIAVLAGDLPGGLDDFVTSASSNATGGGGGGDGLGGPGDARLCNRNELTLN